MPNEKKLLKLSTNILLFFFINILSLIEIHESMPNLALYNSNKSISNINPNSTKDNTNKKDLIQIYQINNFSQCFTTINDTTILKTKFFYSNDLQKELCTKLAINLKYKEDIYYPKYLHKCFPLCNSCFSYSKEKFEMKCISCLKGFKLKNGNCYIDKKYKEKKRKNELTILYNTLNLNKKINSNNINKKYINGKAYYFKENKDKRRKLATIDEKDDFTNSIITREDQSLLSNDKTKIEYNFHIELSPYYTLAEICISKGQFFIENNRCADRCSPQLEAYFDYPLVEIKVGPGDQVTVCDCSFRCCLKRTNNLAKSLDRGYIDGSFLYFRRQDGKCLNFEGSSYDEIGRQNSYLLAQDFVPCFFPIYNDLNEIEFYISGYQKTIVGNNCLTRCPIDNEEQYYYYNSLNSGCYKCPQNCIECNTIPTTENGHCVRCKAGYDILYNGFCYEMCPLNLGEDSGSCRPCNSNEIYIEGKCLLDKGNSFNYGEDSNPSFQDENNPKIFHKCLEYIGDNTYISFKGKNSLCSSINCFNGYYDTLNGYCKKCPYGCEVCLLDNSILKCTTCFPGFFVEVNLCEERKCTYYLIVDGVIHCYNEKCPYDYVYIQKEGEDSFECVSSCIHEGHNYYNTLSKKCIVACSGDDSSLIISENLCLDNCNDNYPENIYGVCENCALNSKYNHNGTCVIKDEYFDEVYFILEGEENEKYGKVGSCYIIDEKGDYHPEHIISRQYNPNLCPNDCPTDFEKKLDENGNIYCLKCYKTCKFCEHTGVVGNHKCTQCKNGYEFSTKLYGVCDKICREGEYFYYDENNERKCTDICPDDLPYYSESEDVNDYRIECISSCIIKNQFFIDNTFNCVNECPEGYNIYNENICVEKCPNNFGTFGVSSECINCFDNNLYYFDGKCYNADEDEIPKETYIPDPEPGIIDDGILHECFEYENDGDIIKTGFNALINNCEKLCPEGYHYDDVNENCIKCELSDECLYCDEEDGCVDDCPPGYFYYVDMEGLELFQQCVSRCPNDVSTIDLDGFCTDECEDGVNKLLYSGDENKGNENYQCFEEKCKDLNLFYSQEKKTCYAPQSIPVNTYFDPDNQNEEENELSPCLKKVSDNEYITGFFYPMSNCEVQCPDYFYYAGNNKCRKCHNLCETCFAEGSNRENNCLSCKDKVNRILNPYLFNCEQKCEGSFHYSEESKKMICDEECPRNNYIDEETGECIERCRKLIDNNFCVSECPTGKTEFNGYCLENVEIPTIIVTKTIIMTNPNLPNPSINNSPSSSSNSPSPSNSYSSPSGNKDNESKESKENNNIEITKIITIMENKITENINNLDYSLKMKNGNISLCEIYFNGSKINCGNSENLLYLNECEEKIKEAYPSDSKFYLMQFDLNEKLEESENKKSVSSQSKYKIYRINGEEININEICKNTKIKIEKDLEINPNSKLKKEEIMKLLEEGINVYDINDPFFNDICYPYQDENGNDIPLESRKEDYYQNTVVCIKGCEYSGINENTSKVMCNCDADALCVDKDEDDNSILGYLEDDSVNNFIVKISSSDTIGVVKCYERTFKSENIKKNVGFWIYMGFLGLLLMLLGCLLCYGYNSLNSYLFQFANEKQVENEEVEDEEKVVTKKVVVSSYSNTIAKENINSNENNISNEKMNPPKRRYSLNGDLISEENKMGKKNEKITFGFNKNTSKEFPQLNISTFGKGYKLSNNFDIESETIVDYQTPQKQSNNNIVQESSIRHNSPSSTTFLNNKKEIKRHYRGSKVELEPDGALLAASNFFDTCRIVNIPQNFSEEKEYYENNITNENYQSNIKKNMKMKKNYSNSNSLSSSTFFQPNKKIVNLPGFPDPEITKEISEEENQRKRKYPPSNNKRKSTKKKIMNNEDEIENERYNDNPLNRKNIYNELEDIDEKIDDSSYIESENSSNNRIEKRNAKIRRNTEYYDRENSYNINRYKRNDNRTYFPIYGNSYLHATSSDNLSKQPITINKYYITNNSNEDNCKDKIKQINEIKLKEDNNLKKIKKRLYYPDSENMSSEEKQFKKESKNINNKSNYNQNQEKIITITTKKSGKKSKFEKAELIDNNIDTADFEEVMLNDHRSFCGIFCSFLSNFQMYVSVCFSNNIYVPWIVRLSICLFTFELFFTFTALIMKVSQFEKRYKSKKDIDIIYLIKNEFTNIIYTTLIIKVMNFISMYIFVHYSVSKVIRDYGYKGEIFIIELKKALYRLKCKYYVFMIIFIILTCLQGYFISCFCAVYVGSIKEWIYSSLIAFFFNLILSFLFIFLAAIFRSMSICCVSWLLFMISIFFLGFA